MYGIEHYGECEPEQVIVDDENRGAIVNSADNVAAHNRVGRHIERDETRTLENAFHDDNQVSGVELDGDREAMINLADANDDQDADEQEIDLGEFGALGTGMHINIDPLAIDGPNQIVKQEIINNVTTMAWTI